MKIDLILQGPFNDYAYEIATHYSQLDFINNIIMSCWDNDSTYTNSKQIKIVKSSDIFPSGIGNRNRQIKSSQAGLKEVSTEFSAKLRSDQKISLDSMKLMYNFYLTHQTRALTFHDNNLKPYNRVCVAGIFKPFPFHPRDHIFWGNTQDLIDVFDIPYDLSSTSDDYNHNTRAEAYIASWYYAKFDPTINHYINNYKQYLVDNAPYLKEALAKSNDLGPKVFKPFPKIDFEWPKHGLANYHYDYTARVYGEYWDN